MSDSLLLNLMHFAQKVTEAERCMAARSDLSILGAINLDEQTYENPEFRKITVPVLEQALKDQHVVLANNTITDPTLAPTTNTSYSNMRIIVAIPVIQIGVIYLDRQIRHGIIERNLLDRLHRLSSEAAHQMDSSMDTEALQKLFDNQKY